METPPISWFDHGDDKRLRPTSSPHAGDAKPAAVLLVVHCCERCAAQLRHPSTTSCCARCGSPLEPEGEE